MPIKQPPEAANWRQQTQAIRGGLTRSDHGETAEALFLTSGYVYDSAESAAARFAGEEGGFIYSRFGNPTVRMFEQRMALLEGAPDARATATGMAAVTATMLCHLNAGDHVIAASALFGSCRYVVETLLPRFGIEITLVDGRDLDAWAGAVRPTTKSLFCETPSNPTLHIVDLAGVADIAHKAGARLIVDNVFATPILQKPMELGADVVVYSATKHIDGQGRCLGGVVLAGSDFIDEYLHEFLRQTGPSLSPFNAWVLVKSLETLDLRVERQSRNAAAITDSLRAHPAVNAVHYPGAPDHPQANLALNQMRAGGSIVAFEVKGGRAGAFACANALRLIDISNNLGDAKTLITHPATTTHRKIPESERAGLGITEGLLRLSAGLEHHEDLIDDLQSALSTI